MTVATSVGFYPVLAGPTIASTVLGVAGAGAAAADGSAFLIASRRKKNPPQQTKRRHQEMTP